MPSHDDMITAIEDAITDVELPLDTTEESADTTEPVEAEASPDAPQEAIEASPDEEVENTSEVPSPAKSEQDAKVQDDFEKKYGITAQSSSGRENRIPYSRVKKITEKAIKDAQKEWEGSSSPKFKELEDKVKNYETAISTYEPQLKEYEALKSRVSEYEHTLLNDPVSFLRELVKIPVYNQIFTQQSQAQTPQPQATQTEDPMPEPDVPMADGSKVYSMEGLKALLNWNAKQVESRVTNQITERYRPLESSFTQYQQNQATYNQVLPQVQQQIQEARTWPLFNESEDEIVKALHDNPSWNLERAYQAVVLPKFKADKEKATTDTKTIREQVRAEVLQELKKAPRATSATTSQTKVAAQPSTGPRNLEDVIADSLKTLR